MEFQRQKNAFLEMSSTFKASRLFKMGIYLQETEEENFVSYALYESLVYSVHCLFRVAIALKLKSCTLLQKSTLKVHVIWSR